MSDSTLVYPRSKCNLLEKVADKLGPISCPSVALRYLERDWAALALCPPDHAGIPEFHRRTCQSPGKRPLGRWKTWQTRLPTLEEIVAQWGAVPTANVGIILGHVSELIGVDIDGPDGESLLGEISGGELPETPTFTTARGRRLLYRLDPGVMAKSWSLQRGVGEVRILGQGTLSVMPPSIHATSGIIYQWAPGCGLDEQRLADAPGWVFRRPARKVPPPTLDEIGAPILEGRRNETLFRIGCAIRRRGCTFEEILLLLNLVNRRCHPRLERAELASIARSCLRYRPSANATIS